MSGSKGKRRWFLTVFVLFNLLLSVFFIDTWKNANTTSRALPVITYFEDGTFRFDKYEELTCDKSHINGHYYTDKAPLPTIAMLPFFGALVKTGIIKADGEGNLYGEHIYILGGILTASVPFVLILYLLLIAIKNNKSGIPAVLLVMLPFYGSFLFVFTGSYFAHLFSAALLLGAYILLTRERYLFSGMMAGMAFISEYNLAVFIAVWGLLMIYRYKSLKQVFWFGIGVLPSIIFIGVYNYHFAGSPLDFLYKYHTFNLQRDQYGFSFPGFQSLWGLSFSWYRGVIFFAPILVLFLIYYIRKVSSEKTPFITDNYVVLPFLIYYVFMSSFFAWWGGWSYGPRFFAGPVAVSVYAGIRYISRQQIRKLLFYTIVLFGVGCALLAKFTIVYSAPTEVSNPLWQLALPALINGDFNANNLMTMVFNIKPVYAVIFYLILFTGGLFTLVKLDRIWLHH
jgi:hypothetical protein